MRLAESSLYCSWPQISKYSQRYSVLRAKCPFLQCSLNRPAKSKEHYFGARPRYWYRTMQYCIVFTVQTVQCIQTKSHIASEGRVQTSHRMKRISQQFSHRLESAVRLSHRHASYSVLTLTESRTRHRTVCCMAKELTYCKYSTNHRGRDSEK